MHAHLSMHDAIKSSLSEFADKVEVFEPLDPAGSSGDFRLNVTTDDPTLIFDASSQFGRIKSAKINEVS